MTGLSGSYFLKDNKPKGHDCLGRQTSILSAWAYAAASILSSSEVALSSGLSFAHLGSVACL